MQNIHVRRYDNPEAVGGWEGWIEPEDRSWILFQPTKGHPQGPELYVRVRVQTSDGKIESTYEHVSVAKVGATCHHGDEQCPIVGVYEPITAEERAEEKKRMEEFLQNS